MAARFIPLTCSGHTRPVVQLSFSQMQDDEEPNYMLVSSCKDGNPMLRDWTGDWIGTFIGTRFYTAPGLFHAQLSPFRSLGHKGAVWSTKLSADTSKAATGSADFTACVFSFLEADMGDLTTLDRLTAKYGTHILAEFCTLSPTTTSFALYRSRRTLRTFSPPVTRRKSVFSTLLSQTPNQASCIRGMEVTPKCRMTALSRAWCGIVQGLWP